MGVYTGKPGTAGDASDLLFGPGPAKIVLQPQLCTFFTGGCGPVLSQGPGTLLEMTLLSPSQALLNQQLQECPPATRDSDVHSHLGATLSGHCLVLAAQ